MTRALRPIAIVSFAVAAISVAALHVLHPDLQPSATRLSEYALESHGWVMAVAFGAVALGSLCLGLALRHEDAPACAWPTCLAVAVASLLSGVFDVEGSSERLHSYASTIAVIGATGLIAGSASSAWRSHRRTPRPLAIAAVVLLIVGPIVHGTSWTGLGQRALWAVLLAGLIWMASVGAGGGAGAMARLRGGASAPPGVRDEPERYREDEGERSEHEDRGDDLGLGAPGGNESGGQS